MEIKIADVILIVIALIGLGIQWAATISSITEEQTKEFNSKIATAKEFVFFWSVVVLCVYQIFSNVTSLDPISKLISFKIALYTSFIFFMVSMKSFQVLMSKVKAINLVSDRHTSFIEEQVDLMGRQISIFETHQKTLEDHQEFIDKHKNV